MNFEATYQEMKRRSGIEQTCNVRESPALPEMVNTLHDQVGALQEIVGSLADRLSPVCVPDSPTAPSEKISVEPYESAPLVSELRRLESRINGVNSIIGSLHNRLSL